MNIDRDFVSLVALNCSGIKNKDLNTYKCRANHYLKDALKVHELPTTNSLVHTCDDSVLEEMCELIDFSENKLKGKTFKQKLDFVTFLTLKTLREKQIIRGQDKFFTTKQKQFLKEEGYLVIPGVLSEEQVENLSKMTLFIAKKEDEAGVSYRYGDEKNRLQRVYNLISKHPSYMKLLELPLVKEILDYYFDRDNLHHKYVLSSFQSNIIYPGGAGQQIHELLKHL